MAEAPMITGKAEPKQEPLDADVTHDDVTTITSASQLRFKVEKTIGLNFSLLHDLAVLDAGTAVVAGDVHCKHKLKRLNLQTGDELESVDVGFDPLAVAVVEMNGKKTVAVSMGYRSGMEIRDASDLNKVILSHHTSPHKPNHLCVSSPTTLLYADQSKEPKEVQMLDCSGAEPKPVEGKSVIQTQLGGIWGMCVVRDGDRELLVCTDGYNVRRLEAYNMRTDALEWRVEGKLEGMNEEMNARGVTTDGRGHLFVADGTNKCIQMFHVADGRYLGALQVEGEGGIGEPDAITWWEATSSLVLSHENGVEYRISVLSVKRS